MVADRAVIACSIHAAIWDAKTPQELQAAEILSNAYTSALKEKMSIPITFTAVTKQAIDGIRAKGYVDALVLQSISDTEYQLSAQKDGALKATVNMNSGEITYA